MGGEEGEIGTDSRVYEVVSSCLAMPETTAELMFLCS
jgi:hypothetical protein